MPNFASSRKRPVLERLQAFRSQFTVCCVAIFYLSTSHVFAQTKEDLSKLESDLKNLINGPETAFIFVHTIIEIIDLSAGICEERDRNLAAITAAKNNWELRNGIAEVRTVLADYDAAAGQEHRTSKELQHSQQKKMLQNMKNTEVDAMCSDLPIFLNNEADFDDERRQSVAVLQKFNSQFVTLEKLPAVENPGYRSLASKGVMPDYPDYDVIPTEFRCYSQQSRSDYTQPDFVVQTKLDGSYQSSFGAGRFERLAEEQEYNYETSGAGILRWSGVLQGSSLSTIRFNNFGQSIRFKSLSLNGKKSDYRCYQQGARENDALISYQLKDPKTGLYQCADSKGKAVLDLTLHEKRQYSIEGQPGSYRLDLKGEAATESDIDFGPGLLAGSKAIFSEEPGTGTRKIGFNFLSMGGVEIAQEGVMECTSTGTPIIRQLYGTEKSLIPPEGSGGLSGLYALRGTLDKTKRSNYEFYYFYDEGHVQIGAPDTTLDHKLCTLTKPNGSESCATYNKTDNTVTIGSLNLDFEDLIPVKTSVEYLEGRFSNNTYQEYGSCLLGTCSTFYDESSISFDKAGRFIKNSSSQATRITVNPVDYASLSNAGNYKIREHTIELRYDNGKIEQHFFAIIDETNIQLFGWAYLRDKDD